ncbi:hypothetical protein EPA93_32460 [Ktedonosporobacter rubrisoli]|uniref:Pyrrolo-quinoline quinone repeat domain-containing protein n=1 Tax=Ktedonosporobacter rubrisoli TaxID=2509675 RepID=A0A4P6JXQ4_KTERU|nr:PQQ-binding-like beta-propeller repeat protein [Ktedonosporobacter rubrisoli]QBD80434.1 hypothetical protein EPA93_32460 [Ktedonosporobacter rubrisoli]
MSGNEEPSSTPQKVKLRLLVTLAAIAGTILILGALLLIIPLLRREQPASRAFSTSKEASGLYAFQRNTLYRLDSRTHAIQWKHTFAGREQPIYEPLNEKNGPVAVSGILYVETKQDAVQRFLSAISATDGSTLWREPIATRAFVNNIAVYTLVESLTKDVTTLTARDLHTGKQLWQKQYPIVVSKSNSSRGTDYTEGLRLITVTDQVLYAVGSQEEHGQVIFGRYALSPRDGAILWQDRNLIPGHMPTVAAQIADGALYTMEYHLYPVPPTTDAHGMTMSEVIETQIRAYNAAMGKKLWSSPELQGVEPNGGFSLKVSGDLLYYHDFIQNYTDHRADKMTLHALNRKDGTQRWQYQVPDNDSMTDSALLGDTLYLETSHFAPGVRSEDLQLQVIAINALTGAVRWSTPIKFLDGSEKTPTPVPGSIDPGFATGYIVDMAPVASREEVYYSSPASRITVLRPSDGKMLTQFWLDKTSQTTVLDRAVLFVVP